ncbi:transglycosylase domain-containing protein [Candidatus Dojkabacteria bacterium]|nr:transglycosylase domain-containing protein [Candidatus Dojkabacteria bacterium]
MTRRQYYRSRGRKRFFSRYHNNPRITSIRKKTVNPLLRKAKMIGGILVNIILFSLIFVLLWCLAIIGKYSKDIPNPNEPFERKEDLTSHIYDRNGNELYKIHGDQNRELVEVEEVPISVLWAFLASEDIDFYSHNGIDFGGTFMALLHDCCNIGQPRGGSTITQQMLKNTVLSNERTYERKAKEIILSLRVEQKYKKNEILKLYLNEIGFGGNTYGIKTAANVYFDKDVKELTLGEAALLAGLPQAPGRYSPLFAADTQEAQKLAKERQIYVLDQMQEKKELINQYIQEYNTWTTDKVEITDDIIQTAREEEITFADGKIDIKAPHFVFFVQEELQIGTYNRGKSFTLSEIERGGLKITTSLDLELQEIAERHIKDGIPKWVIPHGGYNAALVTLDPDTGQILAMVGSGDYFGQNFPEGCTPGLDCKFEPNVNVAISLRQPGSSIKPMVYFTGFETGQLYPAYPFVDMPIKFSDNYEPRNNSGTFLYGPINLRQALRESLNIPAVEATEIIGVDNFVKSLQRLGYTTYDSSAYFGPAIGVGAGDVKLIEHVNAFAVFAANGIHNKPSPILRVEDSEGNLLYDYYLDEKEKGIKVADERACYLINDVAKFYHYRPSKPGYEFAGKTGTSDNNTNTYYIGWSPEVVTGIWVGNNDNSRMYRSAYGYTTARYIWMAYNEEILERFPAAKFQRPPGIVTASVCQDSGLLATGNCSAISDLFIADKLPSVDTSTSAQKSCSYEVNRDDPSIKKWVCSNKYSRYIKAPKPEWQVYWDKVF